VRRGRDVSANVVEALAAGWQGFVGFVPVIVHLGFVNMFRILYPLETFGRVAFFQERIFLQPTPTIYPRL
jgi:hypothetical protein